jgi:hypothetical protein
MKQLNTCQEASMKPNPEFVKLPKSFWAAVRSVSQQCGYTVRGEGQVKVPTIDEIASAFDALGLDRRALEAEVNGSPLLQLFGNYYTYRANTLNKQKGTKKAPAYLTGIVNMIVEANCGRHPVDYDPRKLTTVTQNGLPLRTLSRRVDGAFPSSINPIAIWEIKEYYYTTTFGSRVADGVYETLLDGMEIEELNMSENIQVLHYLFLDARYTWWDCGKSYLCRIADMVQMGYADEVLVGKEVIDRLPVLVRAWVSSLS